MMTMLIIIGGAWTLVALLFCLALAKAARKPLPTCADGHGVFAADESVFASEECQHRHAGLATIQTMGRAA